MIEYDGKNWVEVILRVRGSVVPRLLPRIVLVSVIGVGAQYLHVTRNVALPPLTHTLLGVVLGLLLVFRTNVSYDRWWEGRRLLGSMVNRSRDLARQVAVFVPDIARAASGETERAILRRHVAAYFVLACQGLRREDDLATLGALLTDDERALLAPGRHRANIVSRWLTTRLVANANAGAMSEPRPVAMDANLTAFNDYVGGAERIVKTPLPLAYAQHTKMLVTLFCFTAPFALVEALGWLTPLGAATLALAFFGVDEIGVEIEDPFGHDPNDLPLEAIARTIDADTRELVDASTDLPA
jgi:putative membrane protein